MPAATATAAPRGGPADNAQALRKQRAAVDALVADNMKLKEELMLENKFSVNPTTQTAAALIANLQAQADVYAAKVWGAWRKQWGTHLVYHGTTWCSWEGCFSAAGTLQ